MIDRSAIHGATDALAASLRAEGRAPLGPILRAVVAATLRDDAQRVDALLRLLGDGGPSRAVALPASLVFEPPQAAAAFGAVYESLLDGAVRRRAGAHHTEPVVARDVISRALDPLVEKLGSGAVIACCDPAMGSGVFLAEVRARFGDRVMLYGVDRDPIAVALAKLSLFATSDRRESTLRDLDRQLVTADFTLGPDAREARVPGEPFDLARAFPEVFARGGFDAIVGNPPWVAFAGRAAQAIDPVLAQYYRKSTRAFGKYTTLHGVFVERAAAALRPGGRLGLVVPTSMADLAGYAPARAGHDRFAEADADLPDYGADAFEGVFQPAMAIVSTARAVAVEAPAAEWPLRSDFGDAATLAFVERLRRRPTLPEATFGERGFQTSGSDKSALARAPSGRRGTPLRCGSDVAPFRRETASYFVDPSELGPRLGAERFAPVDVLIRQTARYPIACFADGERFRNSVLAGYASDRVSRGFLLAWLNSSPVRFYHYARFRDARQGMPQVKIQHLRSLPVVESSAALVDIGKLGERLGLRNAGIESEAQAALDALVADALDLSEAERAMIRAWSTSAGVLPKPRARTRVET